MHGSGAHVVIFRSVAPDRGHCIMERSFYNAAAGFLGKGQVMKGLRWVLLVAGVMAANAVGAADGLVAVKSTHDVKATMDRFEGAAKAKGLNVFLRLDHAAGAKKVGKSLRPTELLVFGNPQGGTPLMECAQSAGIDLPLKALAWQDAAGQVWLGYNDPKFLASRHGAGDCGPVVVNLAKALAGLAQEAVK
jgi:uncharacterized protein (DUF302 family)